MKKTVGGDAFMLKVPPAVALLPVSLTLRLLGFERGRAGESGSECIRGSI